MKKHKVLSLFDGLSGGRIAFDNLGIEVDYTASEIDEPAMSVARYNYPDTTFVGNVQNYNPELHEFDVLIGGSPCTSLSFAGKQAGLEAPDLEGYLKFKDRAIRASAIREYFNGRDMPERIESVLQSNEFQGTSFLFWEYIRILRTVKPKFFMLENVRMKPEWERSISKELGVKSIVLNSDAVSGQSRHRLYWVGIRQHDGSYKQAQIPLLDSCDTTVNDISHESIDVVHDTGDVYTTNGKLLLNSLYDNVVDPSKEITITNTSKFRRRLGYYRNSQGGHVYFSDGKSITLVADSSCKQGFYFFGNTTESEPKNKAFVISEYIGNSLHSVEFDGYVRVLTPIECERLQNLPDNATKFGISNDQISATVISNTQRYKMIGNGWTNGIIQHILSSCMYEFDNPYIPFF